MIPSYEIYEQTLSEIARMQRIVQLLRSEIVPFDQDDFDFAAAAPIAAIARLQAEAAEFLLASNERSKPIHLSCSGNSQGSVG